MREICLDTETTGMAAKEGDRIIEIGCVELGEHGLTDKNFPVFDTKITGSPECFLL